MKFVKRIVTAKKSLCRKIFFSSLTRAFGFGVEILFSDSLEHNVFGRFVRVYKLYRNSGISFCFKTAKTKRVCCGIAKLLAEH